MRILLTADPEIPVPPLAYGGIQRMVDQLARNLRESGHSIGLVAHRESTVPVDFFSAWDTDCSRGNFSLLKNARIIAKACKVFSPDIIHSFSRLAFLLPALVKKIPVLMSYQREPGLRQVKWAYLLSSGTLQFSACSEYIATLGRRGVPNWTVIPNFLDDNLYSPRSHVAADAPLIFLSRLDRIKGAHTAIALSKKSGIRLIIAGNVPDKKYFAREIEPHLSDPLISYLGSVNDQQKQDLLSSARAFLLPLEWDEPFGIVFIESLACGTPIITAPRGAANEIVKHGKNGFLCNNFENYLEAVHQSTTISRLECAASFKRDYSASVVCSQYEDAYLNSLSLRGDVQ